jgi:signal transduction histidine kinase
LSSEEKLSPPSQSYVERARSGANRAHAILTALSEATRVEQIIEHTERVRFDLRELVQNMGQAYQQTFVQHRVETQLPAEQCLVEGSPDLVAQLLDKLMDNASDFTPKGGPIAIVLARGPRSCTLTVRNEGPLLPPQLDNRLFESLVSSRSSVNGKPHLGLGLYIVRLIADFHRGTVTATNLPDDTGVAVSLELPLSGR